MGAWWANDPWVWWESFAILGSIVAAIVAIIIAAQIGRHEGG